MNHLADLHIHTFASDGTFSPEEVIDIANEKGLRCISITDHDTVDAVPVAQQYAKRYGIEVLSGIELSSEIDGTDVHILGYLIDINKSFLKVKLEELHRDRRIRMKKIIEQLKANGVDNLELADVEAQTVAKVMGRPHLARALVEKKWVSTVKQAFEKYIGDDKPAYVALSNLSPYEAIQLIRDAGGIPVLAHPMITQKDELIPSLKEKGLKGIEVYYPNVPQVITQFYRNLAEKHGLLMTGGSDAHGEMKTNTFIGKATIPYEWVERLKEEAKINDSG